MQFSLKPHILSGMMNFFKLQRSVAKKTHKHLRESSACKD